MNVFRPSLRVTLEGVTYTIAGPCAVTGAEYQATYPAAGIRAWLDGAFIQDALPHTPAGDREFLLSGVSPDGWDHLFGVNGDGA
jgi:hypothetical protein